MKLSLLLAAFPSLSWAAAVVASTSGDIVPRSTPGALDPSAFERQSASLVSKTDGLVALPLDQFYDARKAQKPAGLDWWSPDCTGPERTQMDKRFKAACQRRDFAWVNYHHQGRLDFAHVQKLKNRYREDLEWICPHGHLTERFWCVVHKQIAEDHIKNWKLTDDEINP